MAEVKSHTRQGRVVKGHRRKKSPLQQTLTSPGFLIPAVALGSLALLSRGQRQRLTKLKNQPGELKERNTKTLAELFGESDPKKAAGERLGQEFARATQSRPKPQNYRGLSAKARETQRKRRLYFIQQQLDKKDAGINLRKKGRRSREVSKAIQRAAIETRLNQRANYTFLEDLATFAEVKAHTRQGRIVAGHRRKRTANNYKGQKYSTTLRNFVPTTAALGALGSTVGGVSPKRLAAGAAGGALAGWGMASGVHLAGPRSPFSGVRKLRQKQAQRAIKNKNAIDKIGASRVGYVTGDGRIIRRASSDEQTAGALVRATGGLAGGALASAALKNRSPLAKAGGVITGSVVGAAGSNILHKRHRARKRENILGRVRY
jgi:hypothetical protein